jgi:hypothetical protein
MSTVSVASTWLVVVFGFGATATGLTFFFWRFGATFGFVWVVTRGAW